MVQLGHLICVVVLLLVVNPVCGEEKPKPPLEFQIRSVKSGNWSDVKTWKPSRLPRAGERVLIGKGTHVVYDIENKTVLRLVQVTGHLEFSRKRNTELNTALLTVKNDEMCLESGFACDFHGHHEGHTHRAILEVGTQNKPVPANVTTKIRLHYQEGLDREEAPAVVCCGGRMELHGAPMNRTWVELGADLKPGDTTVTLAENVTGWRVGDEIIVTGAKKDYQGGHSTEERRISKIDGTTVTLDQPLKHEHFGNGQFRSEIANLSRNVVIESADPDGIRGHTLYHEGSAGGISYARFAHLGKKGVLGRYPIHYHLVGTSMRGSSVLGAAIVDSHNRWVTVHGTQFLLVRDCVGYQSAGHGFFLEDGTEVYNLLDRNLGVQANRAKRLPKQVLPFDPNDGAAFWWANGRNSLTRNVACENEEYGYRYDAQHSRYFDANLPILMPDGKTKSVDIRTLPFYRFEDNESHTEGLYGMVIANNGNKQPDNPIRDLKALERIKNIDWTGPPQSHPHVVKNLTLWQVHYALRPHTPNIWAENLRIHKATYGIYRPAFLNHVYKNLHMSDVNSEPFNRGMDDASAQLGKVAVDGLFFEDVGYGPGMPLVQISDNNLSGDAETHIRGLKVTRKSEKHYVFDLGGGARANPVTKKGVPIYVHDHFGPGRHAKIVSRKVSESANDGNKYRHESPFLGKDAVMAEVRNVEFPELLKLTDDLPPATIITRVQSYHGELMITGVSHDNGEIKSVQVNGKPAKILSQQAGVTDWQIRLPFPKGGILSAYAVDATGNKETHGHKLSVAKESHQHSH